MSLLRTKQCGRKRPRTEEDIADAKQKKAANKQKKKEVRAANQKLENSKDSTDVEELGEPKKEITETVSEGAVEAALKSPDREEVCDNQAIEALSAPVVSSESPVEPHEEAGAVASVNEIETTDASLTVTSETEVKD